MESLLAEAADRSRDLGCPPAAGRRLAQRYGTLWQQVVTSEPSAAAPLAPDSVVLRGEVLHALRQEMAVTLVDVVRRRTGLGSAGRPGKAELQAAAALAEEELGWTSSRTRRELDAVEALYRLPV